MYTQLGVITKGTIVEVGNNNSHVMLTTTTIITQVNVSELGLVTQSGKVAWGMYTTQILYYCHLFHICTGKYAQVTNHPENDGCINAVLLV